MLRQIPHLTAYNSAVKMKYLKNILLDSTPPRKPHFLETDIASLAKLQSAEAVLAARSPLLQLTYTNNLDLRPNNVAIHKCTARLHNVHGRDKGVILHARLPRFVIPPTVISIMVSAAVASADSSAAAAATAADSAMMASENVVKLATSDMSAFVFTAVLVIFGGAGEGDASASSTSTLMRSGSSCMHIMHGPFPEGLPSWTKVHS